VIRTQPLSVLKIFLLYLGFLRNVGFPRNYFNPQRKDERMKSSFPKGQKYLSSEKECATSSICSVSNSTAHSRVIQNNLKNQSVSRKMQVIGACGAKRIPESYRFPRNQSHYI
jgi:hypothetical protein